MQLYMIELQVRDMRTSVAWYQSMIGMKVILHDNNNDYVLLQDSELYRVALKQSAQPSVGVILHWEVANLEKTVQDLRERGVDVSEIKRSAEGYNAVTIYDPDGIRLNIFAWI